MKIPLTVLNLLHQKLRTFMAIVGVAFAAILIFMQLGFYASAVTTATSSSTSSILTSSCYRRIISKSIAPEHSAGTRMAQAPSVPAVARVVPLYVAGNLWRIVDMEGGKPGVMNGRRRGIMMVGFNPEDSTIPSSRISRRSDHSSKFPARFSSTRNVRYFKLRDVGLATDLGVSQVRIVGQFTSAQATAPTASCS